MESIPAVHKPHATPSIRPDRVRLVALVYRKPGLSLAQFCAAWKDEYAPAFTRIGVVKRNLLKYEQSHRNEGQMARLQSMGYALGDFDGIAIFEAPSYEKIMEVFADEEYKKVVKPEQEKCVDVKRITVFPCDLVDFFNEPT